MHRAPRPTPPAWAKPWIASFRLALDVDRAGRTVDKYVTEISFFAGWLGETTDVTDFAEVMPDHVRTFFGQHLRHERNLTQSSRNSIGRGCQQFWRWWAAEEDAPDPMVKAKPPGAPKMGHSPPPVIAVEQLKALLADCEKPRPKDEKRRPLQKGRLPLNFEDIRDAAMLRLFASTGGRLTELSTLDVDGIDTTNRQTTVTGKGGKVRTLKFDHRATVALDRYIRMRAKHKSAHLPALWLSRRRSDGLTPDGVRQIIERRGRAIGLKLWPHLFRHSFAHRWLDAGGAEGDLLELAGWESPQMLQLYGRSARASRAARAYDKIDVMGGV